jgi:hypothetical protein
LIRSSPLVELADPGCVLLASHRPELPEAIATHYAEVAEVAGPELVELCRARVESLLAGGEPPVAAGDPLERAALAFTDQFCHSAIWVTDEQVEALSEHLEPGRVFALVTAISLAERWYRTTRMLSAFAG